MHDWIKAFAYCNAPWLDDKVALQYANSLIQSCTEAADVDNVGDGNVAEEIEPAAVEETEAEEVEL